MEFLLWIHLKVLFGRKYNLKKPKTSDLVTYLLIGSIILYVLYSKGIILANFESISPQEAVQIIESEENNVTILDVRTLEEYKTLGHIENSLLLPLHEIENNLDAFKKFKDKKILIYCASGNRSISASRILEENGFHAYNINGGINNWKSSGYKTMKYSSK